MKEDEPLPSLQRTATHCKTLQLHLYESNVLQCVAVCCSVLQVCQPTTTLHTRKHVHIHAIRLLSHFPWQHAVMNLKWTRELLLLRCLLTGLVLKFWGFSTSRKIIKDNCQIVWKLIERNPLPGGGFLFTMFPHQEPWVRPPPSKNLYQVLQGGSSYSRSRFLMREHSK